MSGQQRRNKPGTERRYEVGGAHDRHAQDSPLAAGASRAPVSDAADVEDLPARNVETPRYIQVGGPEEGADPDRDRDECSTEELDEELLGRINANLTTSWSDWAVIDADARDVASVIQASSRSGS